MAPPGQKEKPRQLSPLFAESNTEGDIIYADEMTAIKLYRQDPTARNKSGRIKVPRDDFEIYVEGNPTGKYFEFNPFKTNEDDLESHFGRGEYYIEAYGLDGRLLKCGHNIQLGGPLRKNSEIVDDPDEEEEEEEEREEEEENPMARPHQGPNGYPMPPGYPPPDPRYPYPYPFAAPQPASAPVSPTESAAVKALSDQMNSMQKMLQDQISASQQNPVNAVDMATKLQQSMNRGNETNEKQLIVQVDEYRSQLDDERKKNRAELEEMRKTHNTETEDLRKQYRTELDDLRKGYRDDLDEARTQYKTDVQQRSKELDSARDDHRRLLNEERGSLQKQIDQRDREIYDLKTTSEKRVYDLQQELSKIRTELSEAKIDAELADRDADSAERNSGSSALDGLPLPEGWEWLKPIIPKFMSWMQSTGQPMPPQLQALAAMQGQQPQPPPQQQMFVPPPPYGYAPPGFVPMPPGFVPPGYGPPPGFAPPPGFPPGFVPPPGFPPQGFPPQGFAPPGYGPPPGFQQQPVPQQQQPQQPAFYPLPTPPSGPQGFVPPQAMPIQSPPFQNNATSQPASQQSSGPSPNNAPFPIVQNPNGQLPGNNSAGEDENDFGDDEVENGSR